MKVVRQNLMHSVILESCNSVTPFVVSAGGGVLDATDKKFPAPTGRNGRQYQRQAVSGVLLTYLQQLSAEFASRNFAYTAVVKE